MPQTRQELMTRVANTAEIFNSILNDEQGWNLLGEAKRQQLITGVNKAFGQAMAFQHEYLTTKKGENKGREVITQTHADVTTGRAEALFAKSTECKSVTKPEKGAVNKIIADAIEQLGGQTGHHPRDGDVRIVDVLISGVNNPWPMPGGSYGNDRNAVALQTIVQNASAELQALVTADKAGARALRAWIAGQTYGNVQSVGRLHEFETRKEIVPGLMWQSINENPHSTRLVYQDTSNRVHKVRCLTIKVRYSPPYAITDPPQPNQVHGLAELVFQLYLKPNGNWAFEQAKQVLYRVDLSGQNPRGVPVRTMA